MTCSFSSKTLANQILCFFLSNDSLATCHSSGLNLLSVSKSEKGLLLESEIRLRFFFSHVYEPKKLVCLKVYIPEDGRQRFLVAISK